MRVINTLPKLIKQTIFFSVLAMLLLVQGCSKSGGGTPNADPTGYYENGTSVVLSLNDLQAIVNGNRIMMMSATSYVLYDGTMIITGNGFTATLTVYENGVSVGTGSMTGTITATSKITGNITGTTGGSHDGDFSVTYANANKTDTALSSKISWSWRLADTIVTTFDMAINGSGTITAITPTAGNYLEACTVNTGAVTPVASSNLYSVSMNMADCTTMAVRQVGYTGLATTKITISADDTLVMMFSKGDYAIYGDFRI